MTDPIRPSQDPWYTLYETASLDTPGTILRLRSNASLAAAVKAESAYQVLYSTTDAIGQPSWAVTTLFVPVHANKETLLSYQLPYNSPCLDKSPSWIYYEYKDPALEAALGNGWWVNVPDHEGPMAAMGAETGQGYAVLDSIRAVLNSDLGLKKECKVALWGFSGGALASGFAAELQSEYAPELGASLVGMALGGPGANVTYAELVEHLKPELKERFFRVEGIDAEEAFVEFEDEDMWSFFDNGDGILELPAMKHMIDSNWYLGRHGVPQMPLFIYHAVRDEIALIEHVDKLVDVYCSRGAKVLYERNSYPNHRGESHCGRARAVAWLRSAFVGRVEEDYPTERKVVRDVTIVV